MPAATSIIAGGAAVAQGVSGYVQQRNAKKALDALEPPELKNPYKDMQISTVGSDILREENARTTSGLIDLSKSGGVRTAMGAIPKIQSLSNSQNQQTRKYLDDQVIKRDYAAAGYEEKINQYEENRYQNELQGLGQQYAVGNQNMWNAVQGLTDTAMYADRQGMFDQKSRPEVDLIKGSYVGASQIG